MSGLLANPSEAPLPISQIYTRVWVLAEYMRACSKAGNRGRGFWRLKLKRVGRPQARTSREQR
jgi:hypothetical protein